MGKPKIIQDIENIAISVKSFGAKGDGITDDTIPIQNALNYMETRKGKLIFPDSGGDYIITDTLLIGSNTTIEFVGASYLKLTHYTSRGEILGFKDGAINIKIINPLIDGNMINAGGSGQNGIGAVNCSDIKILGGRVKNCKRGDTVNGVLGDGGKGIQTESHSITNFSVDGTVFENCHKAISTRRDMSNAGGISVRYTNIKAINCEQFAFIEQVNGDDITGREHNVIVTNFVVEDCGSLDGIFVLSRARNAQFINGKIINSSPIDSIIRGRHQQCVFENIDILADCDAVININPSGYGLDTSQAQLNNYKLNILGAYSYIIKSDTTGNTYPNRPLQKTRITGFAKNDAGIVIAENYSASSDTFLDMYSANGKRYNGDTNNLAFIGNKFANAYDWIIPSFASGWSNKDTSAYEGLGFMKDGLNFVSLKGMITGTGVSIFTLPPGYRPNKMLFFPITYIGSNGNVTEFLTIDSNGSVAVSTSITANYLSLQGITFMAEQ